jgi:hypothetical protein
MSADACGRGRIERRSDLPAGREAASGLFCLLANQPGVDPDCEKPQLASTADTSGSQLTALNCAVDRLRPTPRSLRCLTNLQPSIGIAHTSLRIDVEATERHSCALRECRSSHSSIHMAFRRIARRPPMRA